MKREYISFSALKAFDKSPNHYLQYIAGDAPKTDAMIFGSAFHCFVLEPDEFDSRYIVLPKMDRRTKEGKAAFESFSASGRELISEGDFQAMLRMRDSIMSNPAAVELLEGCIYEEPVYRYFEGTYIKGVVDAWRKGAFILDLKTCADASPDAFARAAHLSMYHEQAALYQTACVESRFYWIAIENVAPYNCAVYIQSERAHEMAYKRAKAIVQRFVEWDGKPAAYFNGCGTLDLPRWA